MSKPKIIAFYLPQFFPIKENDLWWGKGFTEWTNVAKARPLFTGHNQPRIPADLGFYDLRVPEIREQQVELAKEAGVTAFCYWHYWFGNGKRLLERVFDEVLTSGKPDFPFCLGWANHSWYAKTWNKDAKDKLLIEQTYPGLEDARQHFDFLLKAFKDSRYLKINEKPFLFIFDPDSLPDEYITMFDLWAREAGYPGIYLVANIKPYNNKNCYLNKGYSSVVIYRTTKFSKFEVKRNLLSNSISKYRERYVLFDNILNIRRKLLGFFFKKKPDVVDYREYYKNLITQEEFEECVIPQIMPQWDHTPRSGLNGLAWINATPEYFYKHVKDALKAVSDKENKIILLKSWNEWGEGNYMEPDLMYGHGYIKALFKALNDNN